MSSLALFDNSTKETLVLMRNRRERGKYLGCFQDKALRRIFRGYVEKDPELTIEKCLQLCTYYRFVYAGIEAK